MTTTAYRGLETALSDPNEPLVAVFHKFMLTYFETDGWIAWRHPDGTIQYFGGPYTKGFHLSYHDTYFCVNGPVDEACIAQQLALGYTEEGALWGCANKTVTQIDAWVPLDSEITLTVEDPSAQSPPLPFCTMPPPA